MARMMLIEPASFQKSAIIFGVMCSAANQTTFWTGGIEHSTFQHAQFDADTSYQYLLKFLSPQIESSLVIGYHRARLLGTLVADRHHMVAPERNGRSMRNTIHSDKGKSPDSWFSLY